MRITTFAAAMALGLAACGGAEVEEEVVEETMVEAPAPAALTTPEWFVVDHTARTVTLQITAAPTADGTSWSFNGFHGGAGEIVVPAGYAVTATLMNTDTAMPHSLVVLARAATYPASFADATPAFPGAATADATSMTASTLPGESESITFTPTAGEYVFVCLVSPHAAAGMYVNLTVVEGMDVGVRQ